MKIKKTIEMDVCDVCGSSDLISICMGCGKAVCYDCKKKGEIETFAHSVYCSGSGDGNFCPKCLAAPPDGIKVLLSMYFRIRALRNEASAATNDFKDRCERAENNLQFIIKGSKK